MKTDACKYDDQWGWGINVETFMIPLLSPESLSVIDKCQPVIVDTKVVAASVLSLGARRHTGGFAIIKAIPGTAFYTNILAIRTERTGREFSEFPSKYRQVGCYCCFSPKNEGIFPPPPHSPFFQNVLSGFLEMRKSII